MYAMQSELHHAPLPVPSHSYQCCLKAGELGMGFPRPPCQRADLRTRLPFFGRAGFDFKGPACVCLLSTLSRGWDISG